MALPSVHRHAGRALRVALIAVSLAAGAQARQVARLSASDGEPIDRFGTSCALLGDVAVVGANGDDDHGESSGAVYVFERRGTVWRETAKLTPGPIHGRPYLYFGESVAYDGTRIVVGAPAEYGSPTVPGAAFVFARGPGGWELEGVLRSPGAHLHDSFGHSVAIAGDLVAVGAPYFDTGETDAGEVVLFRLRDGRWRREARFAGQFFQWLGFSVALGAERLVVGAPGEGVATSTSSGPRAGRRQRASFRPATCYWTSARRSPRPASASPSWPPGRNGRAT